MTDPIERHIAELQLPEPSPDLDRRIDELLPTRPQSARPKPNGRFGVLALAGGSLAASVLGLAFVPPTPQTEQSFADRLEPVPPIVKTVEVVIPSLNLPPSETTNDEDRLFPAGTIVVSTSVQNGEKE